jgi:hypothetical protein
LDSVVRPLVVRVGHVLGSSGAKPQFQLEDAIDYGRESILIAHEEIGRREEASTITSRSIAD